MRVEEDEHLSFGSPRTLLSGTDQALSFLKPYDPHFGAYIATMVGQILVEFLLIRLCKKLFPSSDVVRLWDDSLLV